MVGVAATHSKAVRLTIVYKPLINRWPDAVSDQGWLVLANHGDGRSCAGDRCAWQRHPLFDLWGYQACGAATGHRVLATKQQEQANVKSIMSDSQ